MASIVTTHSLVILFYLIAVVALGEGALRISLRPLPAGPRRRPSPLVWVASAVAGVALFAGVLAVERFGGEDLERLAVVGAGALVLLLTRARRRP